MGNKPNPILCSQIENLKHYVCECEAYGGGFGVTGCQRPFLGIEHDYVPGGVLKDWVCNNRDCQEGWTLIWAWGDAQRLIKIFGPWDTMHEAQLNNW